MSTILLFCRVFRRLSAGIKELFGCCPVNVLHTFCISVDIDEVGPSVFVMSDDPLMLVFSALQDVKRVVDWQGDLLAAAFAKYDLSCSCLTPADNSDDRYFQLARFNDASL